MIRSRFYVGSKPGPVEHDRLLARMAQVLEMHGIDGATIFPALGVWQGETEGSVVVEILTPGLRVGHADLDRAEDVAERLRAAGDQDSVLWTVEAVDSGSARR